MDICKIKNEVEEYLKQFNFEKYDDKAVQIIKTNLRDFLNLYFNEDEFDLMIFAKKDYIDVHIRFEAYMDFIVRKKEKEVKVKLLKNLAKCRVCGDVIESTFRHDFVRCSCGAIFVDGGIDYLRRGGEIENIIEMSVTTEIE
jgi:hypothetical protein